MGFIHRKAHHVLNNLLFSLRNMLINSSECRECIMRLAQKAKANAKKLYLLHLLKHFLLPNMQT